MSVLLSPVGRRGWNLAAIFAASGFILATWGSRLPSIQAQAGMSFVQISWLVGALAAGTLLAFVYAGQYVLVRGSRAATVLGAWLTLGAVLLAATCGTHQNLVLISAFLLGAGNGVYDVGINTTAGRVARRRHCIRLLPWLHGYWSVGALAGALTAALLVKAGLPLRWHLFAAIAIASLLTYAGVLREPEHREPEQHESDRHGRDRRPSPFQVVPRFSGWSRRTASLGLLALGAAAAESTANEWLTLALTDGRGYHAEQSVAAGLLGVFVIGMVTTRFAGHLLIRNNRELLALAASALFVVLGTALVIAGGTMLTGAGLLRWIVVALGLFVWGSGAALGVPVAMELAAKTPRETKPDSSHQPERVSAISTIGYGTFVVSPVLLGGIGREYGFVWTLAFAPGVMLLSMLGAYLLHPRGRGLTADARTRVAQRLTAADDTRGVPA